MTAGTLTSETLTKAYLTRIALTNAEGPALQAVRVAQHPRGVRGRDARPRARDERRRAARCTVSRCCSTTRSTRRPADHGRLDRARRSRCPNADAALVAKLKAAGAIVLGKTNVSELNGLLDANAPEGYSSLGGQVLLPSDTDKTPAGSSAGSAGRRRRRAWRR